MTKIFNDFGSFIDDLRKSRNVSREDFIDGILSIRQYQRYVNGEASLNNRKLLMLIDKIGMDFLTVHKLYFKKIKDDLIDLYTIYGEISKGNLIFGSEELGKLTTDDFEDEYSKSFYKLLELLLLKKSKKMPDSLVNDKLKKLIDYPNCLENKIISFVEYVAYINISSYSSDKYDDKKILNYLYNKIRNDNISADSLLIHYMPSTYAHISRSLGVIEEFDKSLNIAQKGIDWCLKHERHNSLAHLFMYKAISLHSLDRLDEALLPAKKAFLLLSITENDMTAKAFTKVFEKTFNMKVNEL